MNKRLKIIIGIIILWMIIFLIDYTRISHFKEPIFVVKGEISRDGGSYKGYGLGYRVDVKKSINIEKGICLEKVEMYVLHQFITGAETNEQNEFSFCGTIIQVEDNLFFVEPDENEEIRKSADKIMLEILQLDTNVKFKIGERIKITYDGYIMETYPAQIKAIRYEAI